MPADPLRWDVLFLDRSGRYRFGSFDWRGGGLRLADVRLRPVDREWLAASAQEQIPGFRRWTRFPWIEEQPMGPDGRLHVMDARYARQRTTGFGGAAFYPAAPAPPATSPP